MEELKKENNVPIYIVYADFSNEEEVKGATKQILSTKLPLYGLVNNIGVAYPLKSLAMTKIQHIRETFEINLFSQILFTQQIVRGIQRSGEGSIVYISSSAAYDGGANIEYSASKAAIIGEVKRLALEYGNYNIRVNAVAPGLTDTDMGDLTEGENEQIALTMNIMKRKGKPEEIAGAVVFLLSEMSSFMTAQIVRVDGGLR